MRNNPKKRPIVLFNLNGIFFSGVWTKSSGLVDIYVPKSACIGIYSLIPAKIVKRKKIIQASKIHFLFYIMFFLCTMNVFSPHILIHYSGVKNLYLLPLVAEIVGES